MPIDARIVTFDCYGTLVDWEKGIGDAFSEAAAGYDVQLGRSEVLTAYAEIEPIVEAGPYRSYRQVLRETACRVAGRFGWRLSEDQADFLPRSLGEWPVFPDTRQALRRLADAGHRLGILSNVDLDLLSRTLRLLDIDFELIVTAQDVGSYKPHPAHFRHARGRIGSASWLHAAQSYFHDIAPASELQIPTAWINRHGESPAGPARPDREFPDLKTLADALEKGTDLFLQQK